MSILDRTKLENQETDTAKAAKRIRRLLINAIHENEEALLRIRVIVDEVGKAPLATELASDATELATIYNHIRTLVEVTTEATVPNYDAGE